MIVTTAFLREQIASGLTLHFYPRYDRVEFSRSGWLLPDDGPTVRVDDPDDPRLEDIADCADEVWCVPVEPGDLIAHALLGWAYDHKDEVLPQIREAA